MQARTRQTLISFGINTDLIEKISLLHLTVSALSGHSLVSLKKIGFSHEEASVIHTKINRKAIAIEIIEEILIRTGAVCAFCANGNNTQPYQIHHIEEYHKTQNNDLDNLLLLCPTHHIAIHRNAISVEEQKSKRQRWESIWVIASKYREKNIAFPFNAFEALDFTGSGSITQIFSLTEPTEHICLKLLNDHAANESQQILNRTNKIILSGESGSGKSTMAKGIAGKMNTYLRYHYIFETRLEQAVHEILVFFSMSVKPVIVIVDNSNGALTDQQAEQLLKATDENHRVIFINANSNTSISIEHHFAASLYRVSWNTPRSSVKSLLIAHGFEVVEFLKKNNPASFLPSGLGHGTLDYRLGPIIDEISKDVTTVWELIFLLGNGDDEVNRMHVDLVGKDRLDQVVLLVSINQIGRSENGTSLEEILHFYKTNLVFKTSISPEKRWMEKTLDSLIVKRIIKNHRGRYITIHSLFAIKFIEISFVKENSSTIQTLLNIFQDATRIRETLSLWRWLENSILIRFLQEWCRSLGLPEWNDLLDQAAKDGLTTLASMASRMYFIAPSGYLPIKEGFEGKSKVIADLLNSSQGHILLAFEKITRALRNNIPESINEILSFLDQDHIVSAIKNTEPEYFDALDRLFSDLLQVNAIWVDSISNKLHEEDFVAIASKVPRGNIDALFKIINFQRRYITDLKRNQFKVYTNKFAELLKSCGLEEIKYGASYSFPLMELQLFRDDITTILNALDQKRISNDFSTASPRHWGNLLSLSIYSQYAQSDVIKNIIDQIDIDSFEKNMVKYGHKYDYETRVLQYQLCHGSDYKKEQFAAVLYPIIYEILKASQADDVNDVFKAFCSLNFQLGTKLGKELGKPIPTPLEIRVPVDEKLVIEVEKMEQAGEDYELQKTKFSFTPIQSKDDDTTKE